MAENRRRAQSGEKPLYLLYDQVYWMLTFGKARHQTPVHLVPESAPYVIFVDGISKAFAATGLRVGWGVGPPAVISAIRDFLGHVGAWAPRAEQVATAEVLRDAAAVDAYGREFRAQLQARLDRLHQGFSAMHAAGLPVRDISPQGAIYLSVQFDLPHQRRRPQLPPAGSRVRGGALPGVRAGGRDGLVPAERGRRVAARHRRGLAARRSGLAPVATHGAALSCSRGGRAVRPGPTNRHISPGDSRE